MNPFEYVKAVNYSKQDIMVDDIAEKDYSAFLVNRALSYHLDTILLANEINTHHHIDNRLQFDFHRFSIKKKNRFSKWAKVLDDKTVEVVQNYYNYSKEKAISVIPLLSKEQIATMKDKMSAGGRI
tara:strand:- start:1244 stop:1621 length:378 start_codon:yes stop_codon:yes gene_type:complete